MGNQTDGHQSTRALTELILPAVEIECSVLLQPSLIMQRKHQVQVDGREQTQIALSDLKRRPPAIERDLARLFVNPLLVVELDFLLEDRLGVLKRPDTMPFAEIRDTPLEIVEPFLDLLLGLRRVFFRIEKAYILAPQGPFKLNLSFIDPDGIPNVDAMILDETDNLVQVDIVSQGAPVALDRLSGGRQVDIIFNQLTGDEQSRVLVFGQDHVLEPAQRQHPTVLGGVMLEKITRPRRFKADKDLFLLFRPGMIITVSEGKRTKRLTTKRIAESLLGFLRQLGKVKPASEDRGFSLDKGQLFVKPAFNIGWDLSMGME